MTSGDRTSAKKAARQATEAAMLTAATEMLLESPGTDVLGSLKPVEIARRTNPKRTTGAFYNIWPTHADFRRALLDHVLSMDRFQSDQATEGLLREFLDQPGVDIADVIRTAAEFNFDGMKEEPAVRLQHALWTQAPDDPEIRDRLHGLYTDISGSLQPLFGQLLDRSDRRVRPPYDTAMFSVILHALVEGLHLRWTVDPEAIPARLPPPPGVDGDEPWGLFSTVVYLLFMAMTEPDPGQGPADPP